MTIPEWLKVKAAAVLGLSASSVHLDKVETVLDVLLKLGQVGVAVVTILYILAKWRAVRKTKKDE